MKTIVKNQTAQALTEYLILVVLIAVISIAAASSLGKTIRAKFKTVRNQIHQNVSLSD